MAIRSAVAAIDRTIPSGRSDTALFFNLNARFLPGFRVLIYSLIKHQTLVDLPIVVISDEDEVFEDPLVDLIADTKVPVSQSDIELFANVNAGKIHESVKLDWIPAYTYLKWLIFKDYGYKRGIFIDADIVCLSNVDELIEVDAEIGASPIFFETILKSREGKPLPAEEVTHNILEFALSPPTSSRLNSGVLTFSGKTMTQDFRDELIDLASELVEPNEQALIRRRVERGGIDFVPLSPLYNFNAGYLKRLPPEKQEELATKIKLLHFVGSSNNPWETEKDELAYSIWDRYAKEAADTSALFRTV